MPPKVISKIIQCFFFSSSSPSVQTISMAFALLAVLAHSLPVNNNNDGEESVTTPAAAAAEEEPTKDEATSSEVPEGTIFNYEIPTEDELNPTDLDDEQKLLQELQPPAIDSYVPFRVEEPAEKPRKGGKKYNKEEKWINKNPAGGARDASSLEDNEERQYALLDFIIENLFLGIADQYNAQRRGLEAPRADDGLVLSLNKGEYIPSAQRRSAAEADDDEQVVFQIHGHQGGEKSYKFGFDSGKKYFSLWHSDPANVD